jgi:hypothetical protein
MEKTRKKRDVQPEGRTIMWELLTVTAIVAVGVASYLRYKTHGDLEFWKLFTEKKKD